MSATDPSSSAVDGSKPPSSHHQSESAGAHALDGELDLHRCAELGLDDLTARKMFEQLKSELAKDRRN